MRRSALHCHIGGELPSAISTLDGISEQREGVLLPAPRLGVCLCSGATACDLAAQTLESL
jgi:hypothetical protein